MKGLLITEWLRIRKMTAIAAAIHLVLLLLLTNLGLIFSLSVGFKISMVVVYGFFGLLFAVLQVRLYKEESQWIYLLNRPLSENKVFVALLLAALICFVLVVVLPFALLTLGLDVYSNKQVDWRHYMQLIYLLGVTLSCYLVGCFLQLSRGRWYVVVLILPILTLMSINLGGHVFVLQAWVLGLLLPMVFVVFKMNLSQAPKGTGLLLVLVAVIQWCGFLFLNALISFGEASWEEYRYLSSRDQVPQANHHPKYFKQVAYLNPKAKLEAGLSELPPEEFQAYQLDMGLNEAFSIRKRVWFHPTHQQIQMMDERSLNLTDTEHDITWQFSHDDKLFVGHNNKTVEFVGYMGPEKQAMKVDEFVANERFSAIPWIAGNQFIVANQLYRFDENTQSITPVFMAAAGERLLNVLQMQGTINTIITDQAMYVFDDIDRQLEQFPLAAKLRLALPDDYNNLWDMSVIEVRGRYLLSLLYGKDHRMDAYSAQQITYAFNLDGSIELVANRALTRELPEVLRHVDYLLSPFWTVVNDRIPPLPARDRYVKNRPWPKAWSPNLMVLMLVMGVGYVVLTLLWARQRGLSAKQKYGWAALNAVTGVPGLISFVLIHPKTEPVNLPAQSTQTDNNQTRWQHV